jgi:HEAT repeat protein
VDVAELILDFVRALVWPALVVFVVFRFRRGIGDFLGRIAGESHEFSASAFGLEVTAKFQEKIADLAEQSENADPEELRESLRQTARDFGREQFQAITANFAELSFPARRGAAESLRVITENIELGDLLEFARSPNSGERTGAAIGLRVHLANSAAARNTPDVIGVLRDLLRDRSSLVRYRAAEAVRAVPDLAPEVESELTELAEDRNPQVRTMARRALSRAGL